MLLASSPRLLHHAIPVPMTLTCESGRASFTFSFFLKTKHSIFTFWKRFVKVGVSWLQMYPAQVRGTVHGISAATGKVGSIAVVVWLNYLG